MNDIIEAIPSKKAPGPDGISNEMINNVWQAKNINIQLYIIWNSSYNLGYQPKIWKNQITCVIPKRGRGNYNEAKNYKQISLINCLSKVWKN